MSQGFASRSNRGRSSTDIADSSPTTDGVNKTSPTDWHHMARFSYVLTFSGPEVLSKPVVSTTSQMQP
eukprot:4165923-Pyramimonas_sp.AAC.1